MFKQVKSPAYGTGIASNLVSSEERQRYNYGGRVRAVDGLFTRADAIKQAEKEVWGSPFGQDVQVGVLGAKDFMEDYMIHPAAQGGKHALNYLIGTDFDTSGDWTRDSDSYGKVYDKYVAPRVKRIWKEKGEEGLTQQHPREMLEESVKVDDMSDIIDVGIKDLTDEDRRQQHQISPEVFEEETTISDLIKSKVTPGEREKTQAEILKDQLKKDMEDAKTQGKVAALAEGVSMASHLLDKPFSKAIAAAGKQAPTLVKAATAPGLAAKKTSRQFDMLEALQTQKDAAALIKEKEEWKGKKDIYEFLNIESEEAAEKSFENKKEILELAQLSPDKGFRNFIADKGGDAFSMAQGINAFSPKGGFTAVAAEWQTMKDKKKNDLFTKNKGNVIIDGQGQMIFIAQDGTGHSITLKDLGLEDDRETLDIESITTN